MLVLIFMVLRLVKTTAIPRRLSRVLKESWRTLSQPDTRLAEAPQEGLPWLQLAWLTLRWAETRVGVFGFPPHFVAVGGLDDCLPES